jgi:hypothetical protein
LLSLTPGFSRVIKNVGPASRFNGFRSPGKPLKRFCHSLPVTTGLKPGVNEMKFNKIDLWNIILTPNWTY